MENRTVLYAHEGKVFTNAEIYGKQIHLAVGADFSNFYEITEEEYEKRVNSTPDDIIQDLQNNI